jgi:nucleoside-diphosphate-sugar epimerase
MTRKAFVTGGTGYIGRQLVKRLMANGWRVVVLTRSHDDHTHNSENFATRILPRTDLSGLGGILLGIIQQEEPDAIFHLATSQPKDHSFEDVNDILLANVCLGTYLMEAASACGGIPFVNVGSYWQYSEGEGSNPVNLYAASKTAMQEMVKYYVNVRKNPIVNLILVDTYGEGDTRKKIIDLLLNASISGEPIDLSPGEQQLDYVHVSDVVRGMIYALEGLQKGKLNAGTYALNSGSTVSLRELASIVTKICGQELNAHWGARSYPPRQIMQVKIPFDTLPNWTPRVSLSEGIGKLLGVNHAD